MSLWLGETSLMSQNTDADSGPEMSARNSFWNSQSVKPPTGRKHLSALACVKPACDGSQLNCTCCDAVAGLRNGTTPCGATPSSGYPRLVVGPPEKNPRKYMIWVSCVSCARAVWYAARSAPASGAAVVVAEPSSSLFQFLP